MFADSRTDSLKQVRSFVSVISLPIHVVAASPALFFRWVGGDLEDWGELRKKYEDLQHQHLILQSRLQQLDALQFENDRLRDIISSAARIPDEGLFGRIIEVGPDLYDRTVLVNRGTADGVYVGQPVLGPNGVIGQVIRTGLFRSSVMLITDPSQGIPVQLLRNGLRTIVYGSGQGDFLRAPYLGRTADVRKDDIFITSGLAGRFPAGYPVGRIIKIKRDPNAPFLDVLAQPSARLGSAREVLLIWRGTDNGQVSDSVTTSESIDR
jgi:rod shape-determining protein MreC